MRKIIQIANCDNGRLTALCNDGTVWFRDAGRFVRFDNCTPPQDDAQEQQGDVIDAGLQEHKGIAEHDLLLNKICKNIEHEQKQLSDACEEFKDLQYLIELVGLCRGATDLSGSGYDARIKDLEAVKKIINNLKVME